MNDIGAFDAPEEKERSIACPSFVILLLLMSY